MGAIKIPVLKLFFLFFNLVYLSACTAAPPSRPAQTGISQQAVTISPLKTDCDAQNNLIVDNCLREDYAQVDASLNRVYKQIIRQRVTGESIRPMQRAWLQFRDSHCYAWQGFFVSSQPFVAKNHCLSQITSQRLSTLQNYILANVIYPANDFQSQDRLLNQVYKQIIKSLQLQDRDRLRQAQRAWLVFRDSSCLLRSNNCMAYYTHLRIVSLQQLYDSENDPAVAPAYTADRQRQDEDVQMILLGIWQQQSPNTDTVLEFGIRDGVHHYLMRLDNLPFEAGQWRLYDGQLSLLDSTGKQRHSYRQVTVKQGFLRMQNDQGNMQDYQRVGAN